MPNYVWLKWREVSDAMFVKSTTAPTTTVGNIELVNTHCDYCDSNNCNGWTLRAHPDEKFETKDTDISDSIVTEYPTYSDVYSTGLILLGKRC